MGTQMPFVVSFVGDGYQPVARLAIIRIETIGSVKIYGPKTRSSQQPLLVVLQKNVSIVNAPHLKVTDFFAMKDV